jgi:hypothetical protein
VQPGDLFKLIGQFAGDLDAAIADMQASQARTATRVDHTPPAGSLSNAPSPCLSTTSSRGLVGSTSSLATSSAAPDWRAGLCARGTRQAEPKSSLREKDNLNKHIQAYAKLGHRKAAALLTQRGAKQRLLGGEITVRQSVPALQLDGLPAGRGRKCPQVCHPLCCVQ